VLSKDFKHPPSNAHDFSFLLPNPRPHHLLAQYSGQTDRDTGDHVRMFGCTARCVTCLLMGNIAMCLILLIGILCWA
jgi:hypothetical protein